MNNENVTIRPITTKDTNFIVKWRNNPRVRDNFLFREKFTSQIHEKWLKEKVEQGLAIQYIICVDNNPVGCVYFSNVEKDRAEYGMFIGEDIAVKKGISHTAGRLLLREGFEKNNFEEIYCRIFTDNTSSIKSCEKMGFRIIETLKDVECSTGEKKDMYLMKTDRRQYDKL